MLKQIIEKIIEPRHHRKKFLKKFHNGKLLDVGCGNNSSYKIKSKYPNIIYTGIDVKDYRLTKPNLADNYIVVESAKFAETIANLPEQFDIIISAHNLEHCDEREDTLVAITKILKSGGHLYLSFPTEKSIEFPGPRSGCLNYYDDPTHKDLPPNFEEVLTILKHNNMKINFCSKSYKPFFLYLIGGMLEKKSRKERKTQIGTWAYWGFEAIIWAEKE